MKKPSLPNDFERRLLDDAGKVIGEINGTPIDNFDRLLLRLKSNLDRPEVAKLRLQYYQKSIEADQPWREEAVANLLVYKAHYVPIFRSRRRSKRPLPDQFPDPDDIVITSPKTFIFLGPVTIHEARDWEFFLQARDAFFVAARECVNGLAT